MLAHYPAFILSVIYSGEKKQIKQVCTCKVHAVLHIKACSHLATD